jgi:hypothetical protein
MFTLTMCGASGMPDHRFTVIPGGEQPRSYNKPGYDTELVECRYCARAPEAPGPSLTMEAWSGRRRNKKTGRFTGGTKVLLCAYCKSVV